MHIPHKFSLSSKNKLLFLSLAVGICSGFAAVILSSAIELVKQLVDKTFMSDNYNWSYLVAPGIGMLLSMLLVRFVIKDNIGHGVTKVLVAVSKNDSKIKPHNMWSSVATSALTIGFGGSVGAEAPIVYTGAAIGSNIARYANMSYKDMTVLLGCGAAGAIAGIFKAPLAGVLFTLEILLFNISMSSLFPLLLSTVSSTVIAYLFMGQSHPFQCTLTAFSMTNIPFYVILGVLGGFGSLYFLRTTLWLEDKFSRMRKSPYLKWLVCAVGLGVLIFIFPTLYGEGYGALGNLLKGDGLAGYDHSLLRGLMNSTWGIPLFFALIFFVKVFAMTLTNAGGGVGGTFGPTLFEGAVLGFVVARVLNILLVGSGYSVPEQNFVLVGMAAMMAGVMQAPMTAIFLIAEITGGYELFLPLILASAISFGVTRLFEKYSIYSKRIAQTGELLTHNSDQAVITLLKAEDIVRDKYPRISDKSTLKEIMPVISGDNSAVFPVLDDTGHFKGMIDMDTFRKYMFRNDLLETLSVKDIMEAPVDFVYQGEPMAEVMEKFDKTGAWRIPMVKPDMTYLGFISKSRILMAYREELKIISGE